MTLTEECLDDAAKRERIRIKVMAVSQPHHGSCKWSPTVGIPMGIDVGMEGCSDPKQAIVSAGF